jgi:hypothetical protein
MHAEKFAHADGLTDIRAKTDVYHYPAAQGTQAVAMVMLP